MPYSALPSAALGEAAAASNPMLECLATYDLRDLAAGAASMLTLLLGSDGAFKGS